MMRNNFATHVSRVLVNNIDFFKVTFDGVVDWHIKHQFYEQMSRKSDVVSFSSSYVAAQFITAFYWYRYHLEFCQKMKTKVMRWLKS